MTTLSQTYPTLIGTLWPARTTQLLRWIVLMVAGSLFVAICAQIQVPLQPVPITMQTFAALVVGMAYGARLGAATLLLYLIEGAIGLPVFAGFASGLLSLASGGYIIGFVLAAGVVGWLAQCGWDRNALTTALAMLIGNIVIYVPGLLWLATFVGTDKVLAYGLTPFLFGDLLKVVLAAVALPIAWKLVGHPKS
jgi:biotin transport system substrate-specific component